MSKSRCFCLITKGKNLILHCLLSIFAMTILRIDETTSTNDSIRSLAFDGSETIVLFAENQTKGRGCGGNQWESEAGKNLICSLRYRPKGIAVRDQFIISMQIAVAICRAMSDYGIQTTVKWPNDIYFRDSKLGGILIENSLRDGEIADCIIGIGLNVNQQQFVSDAPNPISMFQIISRETDRHEVLNSILQHFETIETDILPIYKSLLYRRNGFYRYRDSNGEMEAEIIDVATNGLLLLRDREGTIRKYTFKEVNYII